LRIVRLSRIQQIGRSQSVGFGRVKAVEIGTHFGVGEFVTEIHVEDRVQKASRFNDPERRKPQLRIILSGPDAHADIVGIVLVRGERPATTPRALQRATRFSPTREMSTSPGAPVAILPVGMDCPDPVRIDGEQMRKRVDPHRVVPAISQFIERLILVLIGCA
jgi:hypothetical protein